MAWTLRNLNNAKTNVSPSRAGIRDADLSKETAAYVTNWLSANWAILVLVDRDEGDCLALERDLEKMVADAGLVSMTAGGNADHFQVANQIVVEELEVWFFGDWRAVPIAYPLVLATIPQKVGFRDPDAISGGKWEALERVLKKAGYFKTGLRKMECARAVSRHMEPARKTSNSFQALHGAVSAFLKMT
ncbi:MAG: DUF4276 family protein [Nitrospirae bacterium]|nr:DUF4276 family protein [Nitrospirota bacterium]